MRKVAFPLLLLTLLVWIRPVFAEVLNPYVVDEKSQVLFGDSISVSEHYGLENYTNDYVNGYLHITFTYTHTDCCIANYPVRFYITNVDPRATSTPAIKANVIIYQLLDRSHDIERLHQTDWYLYDIQFDATGYSVVVKRQGIVEIENSYKEIPRLTDSDWVSPVNFYPVLNPPVRFSMAFIPLPLHQEPAAPPVATTTPVIIVPGIISSTLNNDTGEKWPNTVLMTLSFGDLYLDDLSLNIKGDDTNSVFPSSVIRNIGDKDFFEGLFSGLEFSGYVDKSDLFEYPYDWRLDILNTASDIEVNNTFSLKEKIDEIKVQTGVEKVNLIAHSMGGLLVKKYLKDYGGSSVEKFIDIGTPHMGAPKAFKILSYGDNLDVSFFSGLLGLNSQRVKIITQNMPSIYELLPSRNYFDDSDENYGYYVFKAFDDDENKLTFDQTKSYLKSEGRNSLLVDRADQFHQEIDNLNPADYGVETYNIVGCGTPTIGQFYIFENEGHQIYNIKMINGDGTVPLKSAEAMPALKTYYVKNAQHALMPSTSGVKELVAGILTATSTQDFDISPYSNLALTTNDCQIPDGTLVSFHSPIELHIYDQSGNHTGPDANGDIKNNISGVAYEVIDDNKFAFLPDGVNYTVKGKATAAGTFDVRIQEIVSGEVTTTSLFTDIPLTLTTQAQFTLSSTTPTQIILDNDNDGVFESSQDVSTTTTGILESTGKTEKVVAQTDTQTVIQTDNNSVSGSSRAQSVRTPPEPKRVDTSSEVLVSKSVSTPIIIKETLVQPKLSSNPLEEVSSIKLGTSLGREPKATSTTQNVKYENTAMVYKSFSQSLINVFKKWWFWIISKV